MPDKVNFKPIPDRLKKTYLSMLSPIIVLFERLNINPNTFTTLGFLVSIAAAYFAAKGSFRLAGLILLLSGMADNIDGELARHSGRVTKFGALYDSTLDRYGEVMFFFGMAYWFIEQGNILTSVAVAVGLGGSLMTSYVRARAEGLGFECKVGLIQRAERILLLGFGCLIHVVMLKIAIWIIAILSNLTAIQRLLHIWKFENNNQPINQKDL